MSMFAYDAQSLALLILLSVVTLSLLGLKKSGIRTAHHWLKAVFTAGLVITYLPAQAQSEWVGWPSSDENDGRFLSITGPLSAIDYVAPDIIIGIPPDASQFDIELFDGDASQDLTSKYDINVSTAGYTYTLYPDPLRDGTGSNVELVRTQADFSNDAWSSYVTNHPVNSDARGPGGFFWYRLSLEFNGNPDTEQFFNALKVRVRSNSTVIPSVSAFKEVIIGSSPFNPVLDPGLDSPNNTYNGDWEFNVRIPRGAVPPLEFSDADADFAADVSSPGLPPDDNFSRPDFLISPSIRYELFGPGGELLILNTDPSGTEEEETFSYNPPVAVPPGLYKWHWFGVDASNVFIIRTNYELFPVSVDKPASLGNYVWNDENGDGFQDAGEPGIAGVTVLLKDIIGDVIGSRVTDSNGGYLFNNLTPGQYTVDIRPSTLPAGMTQTDNPVLAGADLGNQTLPYIVDLESGEVNLTADFGYSYGDPNGNNGPAALGDRVWIDTNGNGLQDAGEAGLGGVEVTLYTDTNGDGTIEPGVDSAFTGAVDQQGRTGTGSTTTNADGSYIFSDLPSDAYVVVVNPATLPSGYVQTGDPDDFGQPASAPDNQTTSAVVLAPGDAFLNVDFGYQPDTALVNTIGDTVFLDANANGVEDAGELGISNVTVSLLNSAGEPITTTTTDADGVYLFSGLPDGDYSVVITDTNSVLTQLSQSADPDSTLDNASSMSVSGGESNLVQDFGYTADSHGPDLGLLGDTVFIDRNANGLPDAGEGLGSVNVQLFDVTGTALVGETTTNADGLYLFGGLDPTATYTVKVDRTTLPSGLVNSVDPDGGNDSESVINLAVDPDGTNDGINLDQDFGYVIDTTTQTPGTIGDTVWLDANANGVNDGPLGADGIAGTDDDEPGIEGVTLDLYLDTNGDGRLQPGEPRVNSSVTDNTGMYLFDQLLAGDYIVDVSDDAGLLNGYWHSLGDADTNDQSQSDPYAVKLPAGGAVVTADFGYYYELASVGDFVWFDGNANGIQDTNEPGIAGIEVELLIAYPDGSQSVLRTLTDSQGEYSFNNLLGDEDFNGDATDGSDEPVFTITVATPSGLSASPANQGNDEAIDSDNGQGELALPVMGGIDDTNDFGFYDLGSISGQVNEDIDRDGTVEGPLENVIVILYADENQDGAPDDLNADGVINAADELARDTTDSSGNYQFDDLAPGNYLLSEIDPDGYESILDNDEIIDVPADGTEIANSNPRDNLLPVSLIVDLGQLMVEDDNGNNFVDSPVFAGLGDTVWYDHNANGVQDANETGIENVTVSLLDGNGSVIDTMVTDATGFYLFTDLLPGDYTVQVDDSTLGSGLQQTYDLDDGASLTPATPNAASVTLAAGDSNNDVDFGYRPLGSLGDTVWNDNNANGILDAGETGIAGVEVALSGPVTATTTTNAEGVYEFTDLPIGTYTVTVSGTALDGLQQTHDLDDPVTTTPSTANTTDVALTLSAAGDAVDSRDDVDFGYRQKSSISGTVTEDTDGDGAGDQPQQDVVVELYEDSDGDGQPDTLIDSTTTDPNGDYVFADLPAGDYVVVEITPGNLTDVSDEDSTPDGDAFDSDKVVDDQIAVTLNAGEVDDGNDFVDENSGSISGSVTEDTTGDGSGDTPQQGVVVELYAVDATGDPVGNPIATTTTAADGSYQFENVSPGDYAVVEVQPAGLGDVSDSDATPEDGNDGDTPVDNLIPVTVQPGEADNDNDFVDVNSASISGNVSEDENGDGNADKPIQGVTIELFADTDADGQPDGTSVLMTTTDSQGNYSFTNLMPGNYVVVQEQPNGLDSVSDQDDSNDGDAFDTDTTVDEQIAVSLESGESDTDNNFVESNLGSISGSVLEDSNGDGVGDSGLVTTVELYSDTDGDGQPDTLISSVTTNPDGSFNFSDVPPGNYVVVEVQPSGYESVSDSDLTPEDGIDGNTPVDNLIPVIVEPGEDDSDNVFVEEISGSISGSVTEDTTGNGLGDTPQSGVTVELYADTNNDGQPDGLAIDSTTTATDGTYSFDNLSPGSYVVVEVQPNGLQDVSDQDDSNDGDAFDTDVTVNNQIASTVDPGEDDTDNNFVDANQGGITGTVTEDTTGDNIGDTPIKSAILELFADTNGDGQPDGAALATTTTDTNGSYSFLGLAPGDYVVVQTQPDALISITDEDQAPDGDAFDSDSTVDNQIAASVSSGELDVSNNFVEQKLASISGWVALDTSGNGHGDVALPGVELTLLDSNGDAIATTTSASGGGYSFNNLPAGDYTVVETQPAGYSSVKDEDANTTDFGDPDPQDSDKTVDDRVGSNLKPGEKDIGNNFVEVALQPAIDIRKQAEGDDVRTFAPGDTVEFEIEVTNTGSVDLTDVVVSDPQLPACDRSIGLLEVGESVTYTCSMVLDSGSSESKTWLDNFSPAYSYSGNDGNANFTGNWIESDPQGGGASSGRVLVGSNNKLWMNNYGYPGGSNFKPSVERGVDLSGMDSAILSFDWVTHAGVDSNDAVALEVSTNGGSSYSEIKKFWGANTYGKQESFDVSAYISSQTVFRFRVTNYYGGSDETFKLDNFKIVATSTPDPAKGFVNIANVTGNGANQVVTDSDPSEVLVGDVCIPEPSDSFADGEYYSIWINGEYFRASSANTFVPNAANGTARYKGSVTSNSTGTKYNVDMTFSGFTTTAPAGSPKLPSFSVNASNWEYYTSISGSVGPYTVSRRGPALQVGYGANMNDTGYGASGWMYFTNGSTTLNGDINISLTDCGEPPVVCDDCISGQSQISLKVSNWDSSRDQSETIRVREGGLGGTVLFEGRVSNGGTFTFYVQNPGTTIVITVQGYYHPSEYVKGMFVTNCDLYVNKTSGNSYITFKVTNLVGDGENLNPANCPGPVVPPVSNVVTTTISNAYAGNCLDTLGSDVGSSVYKRSCSGALNQDWELKPQGSYFEIVNADSRLCLDVYNSSTYSNDEIGQWSCTQNSNQLWDVQSYGGKYLIKSKSSGMCLEIQGSGNAYQYTCDGYIGQQWSLTKP